MEVYYRVGREGLTEFYSNGKLIVVDSGIVFLEYSLNPPKWAGEESLRFQDGEAFSGLCAVVQEKGMKKLSEVKPELSRLLENIPIKERANRARVDYRGALVAHSDVDPANYND